MAGDLKATDFVLKKVAGGVMGMVFIECKLWVVVQLRRDRLAESIENCHDNLDRTLLFTARKRFVSLSMYSSTSWRMVSIVGSFVMAQLYLSRIDILE